MKERFVREMADCLPFFMKVFGKKIMNIAPKDLSHQHLVVCEMLMDKKVCQMKDVASALGVAMSTATALIDKMVQTRYVKRSTDQKDRRLVMISLTDKAKGLCQKVKKTRQETVRKVYSVLSEKEQAQLLGYIKKVVEHADHENI